MGRRACAGQYREQLSWQHLTIEQMRAAQILDYTEESWNEELMLEREANAALDVQHTQYVAQYEAQVHSLLAAEDCS